MDSGSELESLSGLERKRKQKRKSAKKCAKEHHSVKGTLGSIAAKVLRSLEQTKARDAFATLDIRVFSLGTGIPRRRIYDVIDVLFGVGMVGRAAHTKCQYEWKGIAGTREFLSRIPRKGTNGYIFNDVDSASHKKAERLGRALITCLERGLLKHMKEISCDGTSWHSADTRVVLQAAIDMVEGNGFSFDTGRIAYDVVNVLVESGLILRTTKGNKKGRCVYVSPRGEDARRSCILIEDEPPIPSFVPCFVPVSPCFIPVVEEPEVEEEQEQHHHHDGYYMRSLHNFVIYDEQDKYNLSNLTQWDIRNASFDGITLGSFADAEPEVVGELVPF